MSKINVYLSDIAQIQLGKAFKRAIEDIGELGGTRLIQIRDLNNGNFERPLKLSCIEFEDVHENFRIGLNDILFPLRGHNIKGYLFKYNSKAPVITTNQVAVIKCKTDLCEPYFLAWYLNSQKTTSFIVRANEGSNIPKLSSSNLKRIPITLPPKDIQIKIADIYKNWLAQKLIHLELVERGDYVYEHLCSQILEEQL